MNYQTSYTIQKQHLATTTEKPTLSPQILIPSSIQSIDNILGGFKAGDITYIYGESPLIKQIPYQLCINTYRMFHENSVFLDGESSINPYILARYAKTYEIPYKEILQHVHVSRAFTMHQLNTIIHDYLEPLLEKYNPQTLILQAISLLYTDPDVPFKQARTLFNHTLQKINKLTKHHNLTTLITNPLHHYAQTTSHTTIHHSLLATTHSSIHIQQMKHCPRIWIPSHQHAATHTADMNGQLCLQDFGMVIH